MGGGNTVIERNVVAGNDTPNFAPKGNIVAGVPRGTGVMVMANDGVWVRDNTLTNNPTAQVLVVAYPQAFTDKTYNPLARNIVIDGNRASGGGDDPALPGGDQLKGAFGGALPPIVWDGVGQQPAVMQRATILSLGAVGPSVGMAEAKPHLIKSLPPVKARPKPPIGYGAPAGLDARARP